MICDFGYLKTHIKEAEDNEYWNSLLKVADEFIKQYCRRNLEYGTYKEEGETAGVILVKETPIDDVISLKINGNEVDIGELKLNYRIHYNLGLIDTNFAGHYEIEYKGGLKEMPYSLKQACVLVVSYLHSRLKEGTISRESLGDYSVEFLSDKELLGRIDLLVWQYKRIV